MSVPIKHYPTINWNFGYQERYAEYRYEFQLNTIQRLTETYRSAWKPQRD